MHSYPYLFHKVVSFGNLVLAYRKARKRKRTKGAVVAFDLAHEDRLLDLQRELEDGTYRPDCLGLPLARTPEPGASDEGRCRCRASLPLGGRRSVAAAGSVCVACGGGTWAVAKDDARR